MRLDDLDFGSNLELLSSQELLSSKSARILLTPGVFLAEVLDGSAGLALTSSADFGVVLAKLQMMREGKI